MQDGVKKKERVFCNECKTVSTYLPGFNLDNKSLYLIDSDLRTIKEPGLNSAYLLVFHVSIWTCRDIRYLVSWTTWQPRGYDKEVSKFICFAQAKSYRGTVGCVLGTFSGLKSDFIFFKTKLLICKMKLR